LKSKNKLIRDVMTRGVVTVSIKNTCKQVTNILNKKHFSGVCVVGDDGKAVGVISNMDILKVIGKANWENMTAESIMSPNLETVEPTSSLIEAANIMKTKHVHRLLILSEGGMGISQTPIGIVSVRDIVRESAKDLI